MWSLPGFRSAADAAKAPCELDPLERLPCDGLVLQRPARCPAAGRSEAVNRRKIDLPGENRYREVPPSSTVLDEQSVLAG